MKSGSGVFSVRGLSQIQVCQLGCVHAREPPSLLQAEEERVAGSFKQLDLTNDSFLKS